MLVRTRTTRRQGFGADRSFRVRFVAHADQLQDEIHAIERSLNTIISVSPTNALGLLTSHFDKGSGNIPAELIWNLLLGPVKGEVTKVLRGTREGDIEAQKVVSQNLYQVGIQSSPLTRVDGVWGYQ